MSITRFRATDRIADEAGVCWALRNNDAIVWVMRNFISDKKSERYFNDIVSGRSGIDLRERNIVVYDRICTQHRLIGFAAARAGLQYRYSGTSIASQVWPDWMADLCAEVNAETGTSFNSVLINYYRDGRDYISAHSDDERMLGDNNAVAAIALGPGAWQRPLVFRPRQGCVGNAIEVEMPPGALLVMAGNTQKNYTHEMLKQQGVMPRMSFTFRSILN